MPVGRYRITNPTIAVFPEDGRHIAHMVPVGAMISVDSVAFVASDGGQLVNVTWDGKKVMMFAQDLRSRALLID
jgi:uncharacterized protein (AIM24 family)